MSGIAGISDGPSGPEMDAPPEPTGKLPLPQGDGHTFVVVKTATCQWCHTTLEFLNALHEERGDFEVAVIDASAQPDAFRAVTAATRRTTVPQIFLDGNFVGGWSELAAAAKRGQIDAYLDGGDWETLRPEPKKRWSLRRRSK